MPKPSRNRATDPFGGPPNGRNTISFGIVLLALAIFALLQWTGSDLGGLLQAPVAQPTVVAPSDSQSTPRPQASVGNESPAAQTTASPHPQQTATQASVGQAQATETPRSTTQPTPTANSPPASRASALPTIAYAELPPEAHETIALIEQGGPFPFSRDGLTFQNREQLLPLQHEGYYAEYTVVTPGLDHRGARRIVAGEGGEMYYTADHYESFREILR